MHPSRPGTECNASVEKILPLFAVTQGAASEHAPPCLKGESWMPINPHSIKAPPIPVPRTYTPANGHKYSVRLGDTWGSVAATVGMSAWDLIRFNYPTLPADLQQAAKEVNWYLQNYLGCTLLSPDGRNYRFSPPGEIWHPNAPAPLTPDQI